MVTQWRLGLPAAWQGSRPARKAVSHLLSPTAAPCVTCQPPAPSCDKTERSPPTLRDPEDTDGPEQWLLLQLPQLPQVGTHQPSPLSSPTWGCFLTLLLVLPEPSCPIIKVLYF